MEPVQSTSEKELSSQPPSEHKAVPTPTMPLISFSGSTLLEKVEAMQKDGRFLAAVTSLKTEFSPVDLEMMMNFHRAMGEQIKKETF